MSFLPIALSLLISCGEVEKKTAIFLSVQTETDVNIRDYADKVWIYIDPQNGPFLDAQGNPFEEGLHQTGSVYKTYFGNYVTDNDDLEMGLLLKLSNWSSDLPVVEFSQGNNEGPFLFSASGFQDKTKYLVHLRSTTYTSTFHLIGGSEPPDAKVPPASR